MPLFGKSHRSQEPAHDDMAYGNGNGNANGAAPNRSGSMFGGRRSADDARARSASPTSSSGGSSWFGRGSSPNDHGNDATLIAAREKVSSAGEAERAAERALQQARYAARDAKEHVKVLEREAVEDARRAKAKQAEAKSMNKATKGLGRI
ncbi:hypothetical protein OE88DRAFT_1655756 [Heliocybe sulcata]|uniref:Uncharacterized protein n=1 Tax=Heliocybe sulcata TaxID=5364 RepID=A0A5C3NIZ2_9AGAM|nr:hypothetical protein OE88DRAFT_1655756 [Heliocybe sulcata]